MGRGYPNRRRRSGFSLSAEARAYITAMGTAPSPARQALLNTAISTLVGAGIWAKIDAIYFLASHDSAAALINAKAPGTFNCVATNAPTFTVDRGYQGDGATSYLNSQFTPSTAPSPNFVQDSGHISLYSRTAGQSANVDMGNNNTLIQGRNLSDIAGHRVNAGLSGVPASLDGSGFFVSSRTGPLTTNNPLYRNGSVISIGSSASVAVDTNAIRICGRSGSASFSVRQIAFASIGGGLTAGEVSTLNNAVTSYLTAIGAN